ncbi:MAG: sigma-70 family RNA polymerase sigma factor [Sedimentisphaerales bacterium]|nr:sigma-70 family RNA polymerase sigma factor [Sedimentisphaerales bacterium]
MVTQVHKQPENIVVDDAVLVRQCQSGDSSAMHRLIVKYQDRIYNVILKICQNPDDAAELTQETFVKFIEKVDTFQGRSTFYTWLFRIAVNLTYNYCRRRVKLPVTSMNALVGPEQSGAARQLGAYLADQRQLDPVVIAQKKEVIEILIRALASLDDEQRIVIVLRDIEGMSYTEIAESLDVELGTVKSRLSRARMHLREILEALVS